jgi:hypothetical protein
LALSPVRAPPASFMRPLALSIFPSFLSSLLLLVGTGVRSSLRRHSRLIVLDTLKPGGDTRHDPEATWALRTQRVRKGSFNGLRVRSLPGLTSRTCAIRVPGRRLSLGRCFLWRGSMVARRAHDLEIANSSFTGTSKKGRLRSEMGRYERSLRPSGARSTGVSYLGANPVRPDGCGCAR